MERVFNQMYVAFQALMVSGQMLFEWLVMPFDDPLITSTLGTISPMELMFSGSLIMVLTMWLYKFIK